MNIEICENLVQSIGLVFELNKLHYKTNIGSIKMTHFTTVIIKEMKWRQNFTTAVKKFTYCLLPKNDSNLYQPL